jgi:hypothetical protein
MTSATPKTLPGTISGATAEAAGRFMDDLFATRRRQRLPRKVDTSSLLKPRRLADGWWLDAASIGCDEPLWGPYDTKAEALEARRSYLRNAISKPWLKRGAR